MRYFLSVARRVLYKILGMVLGRIHQQYFFRLSIMILLFSSFQKKNLTLIHTEMQFYVYYNHLENNRKSAGKKSKTQGAQKSVNQTFLVSIMTLTLIRR